MTDTDTVSSWMTDYLRAWDSNDPDDIRALFAPDAVYLTAPFSEPRVGVDAIVDGWLEDRDEPDDYTFTWSIAGVDGDLAFVEGETAYNGERHGSDVQQSVADPLRCRRARHEVHRVVHASEPGRRRGQPGLSQRGSA